MIQDVDETLRALVKREALNGSQVEIAFDAPTKEWAARRNAPTINMFLYDIREDMSRRDAALAPVRGSEGFVTGFSPAPRRFKLSYLLTAWTQRPEDEHRLLASCLDAFVRHDVLAPAEMEGALAEQTLPALVTVAQPLGPDRSIADIWSALGGEMKPSLDVVITAPLAVRRELAAASPVLEAPRLSVARIEGEGEAAAGAGAAGAAAPRRAVARPRRGPLSPDEPATQDETVTAGKGDRRGRVFRVRGVSRP